MEQQRIQEEELHLEVEKQVQLLEEKIGKLEEKRDQLRKRDLKQRRSGVK